MVKRRRTKGQSLVKKRVYKKLKIEQHVPYKYPDLSD
jgi:hypothetical protein